jgi:hypothetical protein
MENNASFPNPPIAIDAVKLVVTNLMELQGEVSASNYVQIATRNACFTQLKYMMAALSAYVNVKANGNLSMLDSSGFDLRKPRTKATTPNKIATLKCSNMPKSGSIIARWKGERERQYYIVQKTNTPSDESSWINAGVATKCKLELHGLTSGQRIYIRVSAVNNAGQGLWSNVREWMVA